MAPDYCAVTLPRETRHALCPEWKVVLICTVRSATPRLVGRVSQFLPFFPMRASIPASGHVLARRAASSIFKVQSSSGRCFVPHNIHVQLSSAIVADQGMVGQRANSKEQGKACFIWRR